MLVEIGAALGLYFATGHLRAEGVANAGPGRGVTIIEGARLERRSAPQAVAAPLKQIAGPASGSRRVPRMKRNQNIKKTEAGE